MFIRQLLLSLALLVGLQVRSAHAQGSGGVTAPADAAVVVVDPTPLPSSPDSGPAVVATGTTAPTMAGPSATAATAPIAAPDPSKDPMGFVEALKAAWAKGWGVGLGLAVFGLLELLAFAGTKQDIAWLAWLGKGRVSIVIGGLTGVMPTFIAALTGSSSWAAFFAVVVPAVAAWWHPAGTDPTKAINPVTTNPPAISIPTARTVSK